MNSNRLTDIARMLDIVRRDLDTLILPELRTATSQSTAVMAGRLIGMLSHEIRAGSGTADSLSAAGERAVRAAAASPADSVNDGSVWRAYDAVAALQEMRDTGHTDVAWDTSYQESGAGSRGSGMSVAVERPLTADQLAAYLNDTLPGGGGVSVPRLERLPGGFSKGTFIAELRFADGREDACVIRRDLSFTPLETCVTDEFPLLVALHRRGFPVAEPLWAEADPSRLGAPAIAVRRVAGVGDIAAWAKEPTVGRSIALSAASTLAAIHGVDIETLPALQTRAPGCSGATPADVIAHVEAFWQRYRIEPNPLVELLFTWLRLHAPAPVARALVHGDYGLHNILAADGRISAVLDWEFAHLGDPREDLAYAKPFVESVLPWADFLAEYRSAGGMAADAAALRFYAVLGTLRNALGCMKVLHAVRHDLAGVDSKFVYAGRSYAQHFLRTAARLTGQI